MINKVSDTEVQIIIQMSTEDAACLPRRLNSIIQDMMMLPTISPEAKMGIDCLIEIINEASLSEEQFAKIVQ